LTIVVLIYRQPSENTCIIQILHLYERMGRGCLTKVGQPRVFTLLVNASRTKQKIINLHSQNEAKHFKRPFAKDFASICSFPFYNYYQ